MPAANRHYRIIMGVPYSTTTIKTPLPSPLIRPIPQPHRTQSLTPDLLNMLNRLNKMRHERLGVLRRGEVAQARHGFVLGAGNLVRRLLPHLGRVGPVVLAREHVYRAAICVDAGDARAAIPAAEVEVEISWGSY